MKTLITGGAGFIGINAALYFARKGHEITIFDNLWRNGSRQNLEWLKGLTLFRFVKGDVRRFDDLVALIRTAGPFDRILHLAGQVAVTTSVADPRSDFEVNALGTFNLLEAIREHNPQATIIYASTNKVYGEMPELRIVETSGRYRYRDLERGVDEGRPLDFHSPYGCSKGAADQYCIDYHRIYGLNTIVLRQSCIYGYRQFGVEDQGWVAWFCIAAALDRPITIYGDGKQVRDVLFVDDLLRAFELAFEKRQRTVGGVYNIGGGIDNTLSLLELVEQLRGLTGRPIPLTYADWRPGDQKIFVSDIVKARSALEWTPAVDTREGVKRLFGWVRDHTHLFPQAHPGR